MSRDSRRFRQRSTVGEALHIFVRCGENPPWGEEQDVFHVSVFAEMEQRVRNLPGPLRRHVPPWFSTRQAVPPPA